MAKKLAIAVIHGMGSQDAPQGDALSFSKDLHRRVRRIYGEGTFDAEIAWQEIYWASVTKGPQARFLSRLREHTRVGRLRRFVMERLSDAASYYPPGGFDGSTYGAVQDVIAEAMQKLEQSVPSGTPLLVLAHSLGGHMMSNYMYDLAAGGWQKPTDFQNFKTFRGFLTFGCNIPVFLFACEAVKAIDFPGEGVPQITPWWRNYYDRQDPLGYPLEPSGGTYYDLARNGELRDAPINVGIPIIQSLTPASHGAYWRSRRFARETVRFIQDLI